MSITRLQRNPLLEIVSALPDIALRIGLVGWGCWLMADGLVGPDPMTGRLRLEALVFQPVIGISEAIIHNSVANDVLCYGSLVCFLGGAGVIGLRRVAYAWEVSKGKNGKGDGTALPDEPVHTGGFRQLAQAKRKKPLAQANAS